MGLFTKSGLDSTPAHVPGTPFRKINLRIIQPDPNLVRPAVPRHEHHVALPLSPRPTPHFPPMVSETPVVPCPTLPGVPLPTCAVQNTPAAIVTTTAGAATDALKKPASVTQADIDALAVGDTVVSNGGTTRKIIAISGDTFTFNTITKIDGEALTFFVSEDGLTEIDFAKMKIGDCVSNGGITYTIENIGYGSPQQANSVSLSRTETRENYRAQGFDHIARIIKKFPFQKILSKVPSDGSADGTTLTT